MVSNDSIISYLNWLHVHLKVPIGSTFAVWIQIFEKDRELDMMKARGLFTNV